MMERRVYAASCGLFLAAGVAVARAGAWLERRGEQAWAYAVLASRLALLALAAVTVHRNVVSSDPVVLWQESVNRAADAYRPRLLLGDALNEKGRRDEAAAQFQAAIRLRPSDAAGYVKLARFYAEAGKLAQAKASFLKALDIDPGDQSVRRMLDALARIEARQPSADVRR
jgi:tetratricopeptide (TPR) repeat protein